ncbi:MAG: phospho-sugar mutase [Bacteroidaceae bacterium]|nr:phospho-sugar mutase [Bacteroidaceae bacterium]MBO7589626.1 phospho-sugar mutase [Bacteroidaceae bacterium]MBP5646022.1 phospho-sugar mutase [Bacteroidaceae bacterium]
MDNLLEQVTAKAQEWLGGSFDEKTREEVKALLAKEDKSDLIDAFYKDLEFGTGGLRGIMGAGTNRMNIYTVGMATQGLANYLNRNFKERKEISVVVGHDCRNNGRLFAETVANIFSANGIKVYLFDDLRPTPEVSFAIRYLGCQSGVNVTASHNPREYNGYKAYWEDGAQVLAPHDTGIIDEVAKVKVADIRFKGNPDLIQIIGEEVDKPYLDAIEGICIDPDLVKRNHDLCIVYTPLHGCGRVMIPRSLRQWGFTNVNCVPEQMVPDGNFPTVVSPNPEYPEALTMALDLARKLNADVVMASDPDADRLGVACRDDKGQLTLLNGNQTAMIFLYYIITQYTKLGKMTGKEYIVKTIVTTEVISRIAEKNNLEMFDCYTGFKWIAKVIAEENAKGKKYIGGGEESFGFLAEDFVRDKDAVSACSLMAEIAAWAKENGKTLWDLLLDAYQEYGFSQEAAVSVVKPGKSGADEIKAMMEQFRANPPRSLAGEKVVIIKDFKLLKQTDDAGNVTDLVMPEPSNVLQYFTAAGDKISVRPSGTEPKIKFYMEAKLPMADKKDYLKVKADALTKIEAFKKDLGI